LSSEGIIHIGIVGLGANTRLRHVPGLRACDNVEIVGVCNRSTESTVVVAKEFNIPKTYLSWQELVADDQIDAVMIGTWPYLHCPISVAALESGKHVLTEARMAMNAAEAHQMHQASLQHPDLIAQIVPSPLGLRCHRVIKELLADNYLGELREVVVLGTSAANSDPTTPLHWRQSSQYSGLNMLALGILHEPLIRWVPDPVRVLAQTHIFTPARHDELTDKQQEVGTPDCLQLLTELPNGARGIYHLSGVIHHGPAPQIHLYGSEGTLKYIFAPQDQLLGARKGKELQEIPIPPDKAGDWRVEQEFINAIHGREKVEFTNFETGVRYMEFTEAVARSAQSGQAVDLPLVGVS